MVEKTNTVVDKANDGETGNSPEETTSNEVSNNSNGEPPAANQKS